MKKSYLFSLVLAVSLLSTAFTLMDKPVEKGGKVPDFSAVDENGDKWKLSDQRADYLVVYFYPAAFTGGCTKQACAYRDFDAEFKKLNAAVVGISGDDYENLKAFKKHHGLTFTLLSDPEGEVAEIFGVPTRDGSTIEREVDGQTLSLTRGITTMRWTFIVDANGKLIYRNSDVQAATDPETVLDFLSTHNSRKSCTSRP